MQPLKEVVVYEMDAVQKMIESHRDGMNILVEIQQEVSELHDLEVIDEVTFERLNAKIKEVFNLIIQ
mgnify:CR=1 FL=1